MKGQRREFMQSKQVCRRHLTSTYYAVELISTQKMNGTKSCLGAFPLHACASHSHRKLSRNKKLSCRREAARLCLSLKP